MLRLQDERLEIGGSDEDEESLIGGLGSDGAMEAEGMVANRLAVPKEELNVPVASSAEQTEVRRHSGGLFLKEMLIAIRGEKLDVGSLTESLG